jgi:hypothetical protein
MDDGFTYFLHGMGFSNINFQINTSNLEGQDVDWERVAEKLRAKAPANSDQKDIDLGEVAKKLIDQNQNLNAQDIDWLKIAQDFTNGLVKFDKNV